MLLLSILCLTSSVLAVLQNTTIDDSATISPRARFEYFPTAQWITQSGPGRARPEVTLVHGGTWHDTAQAPDSTVQSFVEIMFLGSGIDVFCIIANNLGDIGTKANYSFTLDGQPAGPNFVHLPDPTRPPFEYDFKGLPIPFHPNQSPSTDTFEVFSQVALAESQHVLRISLQAGPATEFCLMLLDYVVVQFNDETQSATRTQTGVTEAPSSLSGLLPSQTTTKNPSESASATSSKAVPSASGTSDEQSDASGSTSKPNVGRTLSIVFGCTSALLVLLVYLLLQRRRRRARAGSIEETIHMEYANQDTRPRPFTERDLPSLPPPEWSPGSFIVSQSGRPYSGIQSELSGLPPYEHELSNRIVSEKSAQSNA